MSFGVINYTYYTSIPGLLLIVQRYYDMVDIGGMVIMIADDACMMYSRNKPSP